MQQPLDLTDVINKLKPSFAHVALFSAVINILMLVPAFYMLQVFDRVMMGRSYETLLMLTLIVVWLFLSMALLEFVRARLMIRLGSKMDHYLNDTIYRGMLQQAVSKPGQGNSQAISDLSTLHQFITSSGIFAFFDLPWVFFYLALVFVFDPIFGWYGVAAITVLIAIAIINEITTRKLFAIANVESIRSKQMMQAQLRGVEVITAMGMQENLKNRWLAKHLSYLKVQSMASDKAATWVHLSKVLRLAFQSLILGLGAYLAITNEISAGMLVAGSVLLGRALAPIDQMIATWKQFAGARSAYKRLKELTNALAQQREVTSLPAPQGQVDVTDLIVIPPGSNKPTVSGLSFSLNPGDILGIVGPSAAGKSSLAKAMMGVWPIYSGKVRLDSAELSHWKPEDLGPHVGYLPQDIELFEGTVAENIARFAQADDEKVVTAAKMAGVHEMILHLPKGYDTLVGIGGVLLSGGQRQRIGLARAIYNQPKYILLDEPNSNLDEAGEAALVQAVLQLKQLGSTIIIITHRPGILGVTDKLLVMADGQARAFGGRDAVLKALTPPSVAQEAAKTQ